jgi:hypothetical protein
MFAKTPKPLYFNFVFTSQISKVEEVYTEMNDSLWNGMIRRLFFIVVFGCIALNSNAQKVFSVEYESRADVKVFVVDYESRADLLVYKEEYESRAKGNEGNWFFVEYESRADKKVFFVEYESRADVKIYFVEYESRAGWKNKEKIHHFF